MRKYGKNILFLAILALLIYVPGKCMTSKFMVKNHLANCKNGVHANLMVEPKNSLDVLIIGDSESYTTVSPMQLWRDYGITSYAAGQPGAKLSDSEKVLKTAMNKQTPKIVLLETNNLFRIDRKETMSKDYISGFLYKHFKLLKEHNVWKSPLMEVRGKSYKGFHVSRKIKPYTGGDYMISANQKVKISNRNLNTLKNIKNICDKNGTQLILYSAPSPKNYNYDKHVRLAKVSKKMGVTYIDLNTKVRELGIDWYVDTRDKGDHLNLFGAGKTTDYLGTYLDYHFDFSDNDIDMNVKSWNKLLKKYEASTGDKERQWTLEIKNQF
ncbi:MAG: SGNH/GDSL hydrolase family protein [Lachnospiraceae bacterium]|nr:SGNH/GDSL hydrolase family protein [Lachnospiraceae bacterium]